MSSEEKHKIKSILTAGRVHEDRRISHVVRIKWKINYLYEHLINRIIKLN